MFEMKKIANCLSTVAGAELLRGRISWGHLPGKRLCQSNGFAAALKSGFLRIQQTQVAAFYGPVAD